MAMADPAPDSVNLADVPITDLVITRKGLLALAGIDTGLDQETLEVLRDLAWAQQCYWSLTGLARHT